jgi:hypothetical protein
VYKRPQALAGATTSQPGKSIKGGARPRGRQPQGGQKSVVVDPGHARGSQKVARQVFQHPQATPRKPQGGQKSVLVAPGPGKDIHQPVRKDHWRGAQPCGRQPKGGQKDVQVVPGHAGGRHKVARRVFQPPQATPGNPQGARKGCKGPRARRREPQAPRGAPQGGQKSVLVALGVARGSQKVA